MDNLFPKRNQHYRTRMESIRGRHRLPPHSLPGDGNTNTQPASRMNYFIVVFAYTFIHGVIYKIKKKKIDRVILFQLFLL